MIEGLNQMDKKIGFHCSDILKHDAFGTIEKGYLQFSDGNQITAIRRVYSTNRVLKPLTRLLANNEIRALKRLQQTSPSPYFPRLLANDKNSHLRSYIEGDSMHKVVDELSDDYFKECHRLLEHLVQHSICNNDLAKEANWLVNKENGKPAITDFQLAFCFKNKQSRIFKQLARDDKRHLLKHQRKYNHLNTEELLLIEQKSLINKLWMNSGKRLHKLFTRKILGWQERNGPEERNI